MIVKKFYRIVMNKESKEKIEFYFLLLIQVYMWRKKYLHGF